ncbi:MAG: N-acetylmuramic acid 6-phosphate etherase [Flavobacteriaceae bacterium]|uniref:SIS domain-containing protein n=1 Tax=marine metagenome TaxID=408172 RepID=A0A382CPR1_9ZZZZ|nr:N-acetylmuramic acid 6-phosphate etherase [Flavobacteriaceae bacterium]
MSRHFIKTTEKDSVYNNLELKSTREILSDINQEDKTVAYIVEKNIPKIETLVDNVYEKLQNGGRLFYIGSGTSGRLGILDASECPPTFGVDNELVFGIIAGGDKAIRKSQEYAEDSLTQAWKDLNKYKITKKDIVIGIAASGTTPYVLGGIEECNKNDIATGCITCNKNSPLSYLAKYPIEAVVGPEYITGSSRMKAGTAQKLILNMISSAVMIRLGKIKGNKMVDMQLANNKLVKRGEKIIKSELDVTNSKAKALLKKTKNVRKAIESFKKTKK